MLENLKSRLRKGMLARTAEGKQLGKIYEIGGDTIVTDGGGARHDYVADFDQISEISDDEVIVASRDAAEGEAYDASTDRADQAEGGAVSSASIPLIEEKLEASKRVHQAGEVRLRKRVVTEKQEFTVPVMKETVRVERIPVEAGRAAATDAKLADTTVSIPVMEEEVVVTKRPVVREEVRLRKDRTTEERRVADTVRHEEIEVDENVKQRRPEESAPGYSAPGFDPKTRR